MNMFKRTALVAAAVGLAFAAFSAVQAAGKPLVILESVPGLTFPFFVHMMNQMKAEAAKLGDIKVIESDGQVSSPKQTADVEAAITQKVNGIVISPNEVDAMAPALQEAVDAGIPVVTIDRRVAKVPGILAHVGADNVLGGEAQGHLVMTLFPNGAKVPDADTLAYVKTLLSPAKVILASILKYPRYASLRQKISNCIRKRTEPPQGQCEAGSLSKFQ